MNKKSVLLTILILLVFLTGLIGTATAAENYKAKIVLSKLQVTSGVMNWVDYTTTLNQSNQVTAFGITVRYEDIDQENHDMITFSVSSTGAAGTIKDPLPVLKANQEICLIGTCPKDDLVNKTSYAGNVNMKLVTITKTGTTSSSNTTTDTPIFAYVIVDSNKKSLIKDGTITFDAKAYTQDTGWSSDSIVNNMDVYFERQNTEVTADISLTASVPSIPQREETDTWVKYRIKEAGTYKFKVVYDDTSAWGKTVEVTNMYTFIVKNVGVTSAASTKTPTPSLTQFDASVGVPKRVTMATYGEGQFDSQPGATISNSGNNIYAVTFDSAGTKQLKYTPANGDPVTLTFSVTLPTPAPTPAATQMTAGQQQQTGGDNTYLIIGGVAVILILGYIALTKRKKGGGGKYQIHGQPQ